MPLYEFLCSSCGYQDELILKVNHADLKICPNCNQPKLRRKASVPSFHLKGAGWYKDGYGIKKPAAEKSGESGANAKDVSKKTQTKPKVDSKTSENAKNTAAKNNKKTAK